MAEKKRKTREGSTLNKPNSDKKRKQSYDVTKKKKKSSNKEEKTRKGPRLPNVLRKHLESLNPNPNNSDDDEINSDEEEGLQVNDVYEYEEPMPEEESKKNRRYDPVDNLEYQLPDEFEDENLPSDDDDDDSADDGDAERHGRMLQGITGLPAETFQDKKNKTFEVVTEAYPESEFNPPRSVTDGNDRITVEDLLDPLRGKPEFGQINKRLQKLKSKSKTLPAPLPKATRENIERKVAYEISKKDITKWEPLVKRNREAPTLYFDQDTDLEYSTVGAIASEFEPRTDFEKKMASIVHDPAVAQAHKEDGARLLELNTISIEDVKERHNHLAKMRSLLFRHEIKGKRIKKIKSKTFHRLLKRDKTKAASALMEMDPEAAKEQAKKQEFKRAEEHMRLKHKNSSKWAKRILKRGLDVQDEGTRSAISEQLHQHNLLTRKMNSMKDSSSSDESSDEDDDEEFSPDTEQDGASKILRKAKDKTIKIIEEDDVPTSGVLALPFMVRGLKKRKEEATKEANLALEEFEKQLEKPNLGSPKVATSSGRRVFGAIKKQSEESSKRIDRGNYNRDSDSEDDFKTEESVDVAIAKNDVSHKEVHFDSDIFHEEADIGGEPVLKNFDDIVRDPGPKTTYEVSIFASDSWRKMGDKSVRDGNISVRDGDDRKSSEVLDRAAPYPELKEVNEDEDTENEEMVEGNLSHETKTDYELPSQDELRQLAFAGDDVEEEFEKEKMETVNVENPEPEKPLVLPGWGEWTCIQKKKGMPSWMREEHENAKKKREDALNKRKDAHLKHVIISEKINKKAEKLHTKSLPYPYTSKEVFEIGMRMPIGPEFNPATSIGALNRPEVVMKPGVIIKPIKFEDVDPYEKVDDHKKGVNQKTKKNRSNRGKTINKIKTKGRN